MTIAPQRATTTPKIGTSSPIPDKMMIYDDLTILMYRNIINKLACLKATLARKYD